MKKITKATFKSFIKKNKEQLLINLKSSFDGMVDCCMPNDNKGFHKAIQTDKWLENSLGIAGIWLVDSSGNYFQKYEDVDFTGIEVSNCCGHFILAISK